MHYVTEPRPHAHWRWAWYQLSTACACTNLSQILILTKVRITCTWLSKVKWRHREQSVAGLLFSLRRPVKEAIMMLVCLLSVACCIAYSAIVEVPLLQPSNSLSLPVQWSLWLVSLVIWFKFSYNYIYSIILVCAFGGLSIPFTWVLPTHTQCSRGCVACLHGGYQSANQHHHCRRTPEQSRASRETVLLTANAHALQPRRWWWPLLC